MGFALQAAGVFVAAFLVDVAYAYYIRRSAQGRAVPAALWSGGIALAGAYNVIAYTKDPRLLVPMLVGYVLGTYVAVKRDHAEGGG
jgi:hypothetical protein